MHIPDEIMSTPLNQAQGTAELTLRLHDFLSVGDHLCKAIDEIVAKYKTLGKKCVEDLMILKDGMSLQQNEVKQLVGKVSIMPLSKEAYSKLRNESIVSWEEGGVKKAYKNRESVYRVKQFVKCANETKSSSNEKKRERQNDTPKKDSGAVTAESEENQTDETNLTPPTKKSKDGGNIVTPTLEDVIMSDADACQKQRLRKSRVLSDMTDLIGTGKVGDYVHMILEKGPLQFGDETYETPNSIFNLYNKEGFDGEPPIGQEQWTKIDAFKYLFDVEGEEGLTVTSCARALVAKDKCGWKERSSVTKAYAKWKENGTLSGRGHPKIALLEDVRQGLVKKMNSGTMKSNAIQINDVKEVLSEIAKDKAASDGLDPNSIDSEVSDRTAKRYFLAIGMMGLPDQPLVLSCKTLNGKTESRLVMENSVCGAYTNMQTCLSTHFLEGERPKQLGGPIDYNKLDPEVAETFEMVKELLQAKDVFAIHPSLAISTDDTVVFVFEGTKQSGEWKWKLIPRTDNNAGINSDFEVDESGKLGGLRVRFTFTFTAAGQMAPAYITISGLTEEELDPELCPSGFLAKKVPNLCKGGNDVHSNGGFGWVVFMRSDKKKANHPKDKPWLGMAQKKHAHYNQYVLLPFIRKLRELLGWKLGDPIPEWLRACCWCDGDIPQLQAMLLDANEALDEAENIVRNKHPAAGTSVFQPGDLCPVFKLLKFTSARTTSANVTATAFKEAVEELIDVELRKDGLNLDGNVGKKKGVIDLLSSMPKILEVIGTEENVKVGFYKGGMIDKKEGLYPTYAALMNCCKRWGSRVKGVGVTKEVKEICKKQYTSLGKIQLEKGQISYDNMIEAGLPRDIDLDGKEIFKARPSGTDSYHLQYALTINSDWQQRERQKKQQRKAEEKYAGALEEYNSIEQIISCNKSVEKKLQSTTESGSLVNVSVDSFMKMKVSELKDFIHCRKFKGKTFKEAKLLGSSSSLKKTLRRNQTADEIQSECSEDNPCLVWLAWKLRSNGIVLKQPAIPTLELSAQQQTLTFQSGDTTQFVAKKASDYLQSDRWISSFESAVKGVTVGEVNDEMQKNADRLISIMRQRLNFHVSTRVDQSCYNHITLQFVAENLPVVAAQMCLVGHVINDVETSECQERLIKLPSSRLFKLFDKDIGALEGCYLVYDATKDKWIRDGFACGAGADACLEGRKEKHRKNSKSIEEMRSSRFYRNYASKSVTTTVGKRKGCFEDLVFYCAMAFDAKNAGEICTVEEKDSIFVWSKEFVEFLSKKAQTRETSLERVQLSAVAYLWEICYDLMLSHSENISDSPGFEGFGLRVRKRTNLRDQVLNDN